MTASLHALALDRRFIGWALVWTVVALVAFGLVTAIIPNPVFGRQIPPEPFAIATWVLSAPLQPVIGAASLGLLAVTTAWRFRLRSRGRSCPV